VRCRRFRAIQHLTEFFNGPGRQRHQGSGGRECIVRASLSDGVSDPLRAGLILINETVQSYATTSRLDLARSSRRIRPKWYRSCLNGSLDSPRTRAGLDLEITIAHNIFPLLDALPLLPSSAEAIQRIPSRLIPSHPDLTVALHLAGSRGKPMNGGGILIAHQARSIAQQAANAARTAVRLITLEAGHLPVHKIRDAVSRPAINMSKVRAAIQHHPDSELRNRGRGSSEDLGPALFEPR